ncbi:MAG TPA: ABC transporter permease subunit [Xanthobacteraceae bacterium]|jgi:NitT/TauT family transport system permease protein|nr:ABC transporter permease subunit [Xanthobacteraceae bacterium]
MKSTKLDYLLLAVGLLLVWQVLYWGAGPSVVSSPAVTAMRAFQLVRTEAFWVHAASTGAAFALASVISIVGGTMLGLWLGLRRFAGDVADPILSTLYSIPKITLYPLILLMFGLGASAKVAFGVIHGVIPIAIFSMNAVRNVAPIYHRTARIMRLSPLATVVTIMGPAALPEILTGIRIGIALTLFGTLIGELFASTSGLGFALMRATDIHAVPDILAITLLLFLFAASLNALLHVIERRARHNA